MKPGILIRGGTGSTVYGIDMKGKNHTTNAWDPILGDQGGGMMMTIDLLRVAARFEDNRLRSPAAKEVWKKLVGRKKCKSLIEMHEKLLERQEVSGNSFNDELFQLNQCVFELAASGNIVAEQIINAAAAELVSGVEAVLHTLSFDKSKTIPIFLSGNVLCKHKCFQVAVVNHLHKLQADTGVKFGLSNGKYIPAVGAAFFACSRKRGLPEEKVTRKMIASFSNSDKVDDLYYPDIDISYDD